LDFEVNFPSHVPSFCRGTFWHVFKHFWDVFDLKDFVSNFLQLHQLSSHVAMGCFSRSIAHILGVARFLALVKLSSGIRLITMCEVFYWLVRKALCF
jgi:hypothetical protein